MKLLSMVLLASFCFTNLSGQAKTGSVYLTVEDFEKKTAAFSFPCDSTKIKIHEFFGRAYLDVVVGKKDHRFNKATTFGFRDCANATFRFYKEDIYHMLNRGPFILYRQDKVKNKSVGLESFFFFSTTAKGEIQPLNIRQLKAAFRDEPDFTSALNTQFTNDDELTSFDKSLGEFRLILLYKQSVPPRENNKQ